MASVSSILSDTGIPHCIENLSSASRNHPHEFVSSLECPQLATHMHQYRRCSSTILFLHWFLACTTFESVLVPQHPES